MSRSGPPQHRNLESCGGKNVQARLPHSVNLTGKNKCSSAGQTGQMDSDLKQGVFEDLPGLIIERSSAGQTGQMESDLKQGVFEDLPGLIIECSSAGQTGQMESDLKQGVFEDIPGLIIERSSAGQTRQMESDLKQGVFEDLPGLIIEREICYKTSYQQVAAVFIKVSVAQKSEELKLSKCNLTGFKSQTELQG